MSAAAWSRPQRPADADCKLLRLADCCCEIRLDWQIDTEAKEVVLLPTSWLNSSPLYFVQRLVISLEIRKLFTADRPQDESKSGPPHNLYLLHRSLLI